jgi:hypothetical protein
VKHPLTDVGLQRFDQDWKALQEELRAHGLGGGKEGA